MGPMTIFDKSFLQALNPDEAALFDALFMTNITPLFFVETLADLEKEVRSGRTPETVVGGLAYKTPKLRPYGRDKSAADDFLQEQNVSIPITIFRPPYIYGPGNNLDRETFIWGRVLRGRPVIVPGQGDTRIQFVHTFDLSMAIGMALTSDTCAGTEIYNIGTDEQPTFKEYVSTLATIAGAKDTSICIGEDASEYTPRQYFPFRDYPCVVDNSHIKADLKWKPRFNFTDGFRNTFESYDPSFLRNRPIETSIEDKILNKISSQPSILRKGC